MYYEKTKKIMVASVSGAVLNLVLNVICINLFGYIAAAYTTLICYMFFAFAHYIIMRLICREYLNNIEIYDMKFIIILSIIFTFTYGNMLIRYLIIAIICTAAFWKRNLFISSIRELKKGKKKGKA